MTPEQLRRLVVLTIQPQEDPVVTDQEIDDIVELGAMLSLTGVLHRAVLLKVSKSASYTDASADGVSSKDSQNHEHWKQIADDFALTLREESQASSQTVGSLVLRRRL